MKKRNKKTLEFTHYRFHAILLAESMVPITLYVMYRLSVVSSYDKLSMLFGMVAYYGTSVFVYKRFFKMEKKDELVQLNIARANRITLYLTLGVLFSAVIINDYILSGFLSSDMCFLLVSVAMALRSFLFMLFEGSPVEENE